MTRLPRWLRAWWRRHVCAPEPVTPRIRFGPAVVHYATECSPHPLREPVEWIGTDDPDEAWSAVAGVDV